ncbi:TAXI family TRAP transporter solute-binding subunit [Paucibacter sp. Y2R2-4]|uniref:TAXI family TRAP transporter solute-binding subunit n=1 Tax=Paucibacter sp. Y2R2-4 TaxID=2893553 RepID=UPI0021E48A32|nr:TAXI family TRAP transporter solute-binding subunit [Paucibacter sp. Y2R2-4]MCV2350759.1 TAXI family TRAP transporter solute-binding subunit [Paucibacter sp. Y2R2-4]
MSASRSLTRSFRDGPRALLWLALVLSLGLAAYFAVKHFSPAPPKSIVMVTGSPDGAYHQFGLKYQALLKLNGITLTLQPSSGSVENLAQLNAGQADVGFVQGGLGPMATAAHSQLPDFEALEDDEQPNTPLRSLATVAHEPVWIFSRTLRLSDGLGPLKGQRVAVGVAGSGNQKVALELLSSYGVTDSHHHPLEGTTLVSEGGMAAVELLLADQIDALILVASVQSPVVQKLLASDGLRLASLHQAEGLARRLPYFETVVLKRGSVSPLLDRPNKDITLLATTTNLVIQEDLHPALAYLLLEAARQTHRAPSLLARPGEFPNPQGTDFPLAEESARYFKNGRPFLQTYLPFWMANLVQRLVLMALPVLALLLPLIRLLPWLRSWRQSRRIYRHYGELKFLEQDLLSHQLSPEERAQARESLDRIERDVLGTRFPIDFTDRVYTLRQHVELVRRNLARPGPTEP